MQEKYESKGVVILALSYEPAALVRKFIKTYIERANKSSKDEDGEAFKFNYIIGMDAGGTKNAYKVSAYPTLLVVDTEGKIAYRGHSPMEAEQAIERLLKDAPPKDTLPLVESAAKRLYQKAVGYAKKKKYAKALEAFDECAKDYKDTDYGKKAAAGAKRIRGSKKMMARIAEREAKKECEAWLNLARACAEAGQRDNAAEYYDKIIKKYPDTSYAKTAREEKAKL